MVTVALVDDHPILLAGIQSILGRRAGYDVVGTGSRCDDAVEIARSVGPDVMVLDLNMEGDAFACIRSMAEKFPNTKVIVFTASAGMHHAVQALEAGASGYVLKGAPLAGLVEAIDTVVHGETYITQGFAAKLIGAMGQSRVTEEFRMSARENQIVRLVLEGKTNRQIGEKLDITEKTVKHYMTIIMNKLNVKNRVGVAMVAQSLVGWNTSEPRQSGRSNHLN